MTVEEQLRTKGQTPFSAYLELTKPGIALFVTITAGVAYAVAGAPALDWLLLFHVTFGVYLSTSGALALNQVLEQGLDGLMDRTQNRPIPS